jgi:hypothetical protein
MADREASAMDIGRENNRWRSLMIAFPRHGHVFNATLHRLPASFETRPLGASQDEVHA